MGILINLTEWDAAESQMRLAAANDVARRLPTFLLLRLETFSCGGQAHEVAVFIHVKTGMEFVLVPGGSFGMGASETSWKAGPVHRVTLTRPFLVARTEVTQEQWQTQMGTNPCVVQAPTKPVENVRWHECTAFLERLNGDGETSLALPTEAQWEYACGAGTTSLWSFGDDEADFETFGWAFRNCENQRHPVGLKCPNAFGLYDVHGNVAEWCADWHGPYSAGVASDPIGPGTGTQRVYRGGAWCLDPGAGFTAYRGSLPPSYSDCWLGFRPVQTVRMK